MRLECLARFFHILLIGRHSLRPNAPSSHRPADGIKLVSRTVQACRRGEGNAMARKVMFDEMGFEDAEPTYEQTTTAVIDSTQSPLLR